MRASSAKVAAAPKRRARPGVMDQSRDELLEKIWGVRANATNRTVDNFVVKLRRKLEEDQKNPRHILTVYGYGYKLVP